MIPGSNILNKALTVIKPVPVQYFRFSGRTTNAIGLDVSGYEPAVTIQASVQAVKRSQYKRMGLDYANRYIKLWTSADVEDLYRDRSGDQVTFSGRRYEILDETDWTPIDGWNSGLAVDVGAA